MARFLAIDADGPNIALLSATIGRGGTPRLEKVAAWTADGPLTLDQAEAIGRALRERLNQEKIAAAPLITCVGRERVVFKDVKYPAVPDNEEPAVVRFQAIKELTEPPDEVVIDYQRRPGSSSERRALVVAARKEVVILSQRVAAAAGLKLHAVIPRPFALAAAARASKPGPDPGAAFAVLAFGATGGEFLVGRDDELLFARPVSAPALGGDAALLGEVRRNLAVYSGQNPTAPVKSIIVADGGTLRGFAQRVAATLAVPVTELDALAGSGLPGPDVPAQWAAVCGAVRLAAGELPINFIKPREPKPPADPHRRPLLFGAALALTLLFAAGALAWMQLADRDRTISELRRDLESVSLDLSRLEPDAKRSDEVRKWMDTGVVWLDELYDLAAKFPDLNKLRLTQLSADPVPLPPNPKPGAKLYVGRISIEGLTTDDSRPLSQLMSELAKEPAYKVEAKNTKPLQFGADRRSFANSFTTRYELEKRPIDSYVRKFDAEAPARRSRGGNRAGGIFEALMGGAP